MSTILNKSDSARTRPNAKASVNKLANSLNCNEDDFNFSNCFTDIIRNSNNGSFVPDSSNWNNQPGSIINVVDPNITSCNEHQDMYLHTDDTLIKPGDEFESHESFRHYINQNAERWLYYYSCADSRTHPPDKEFYVYKCVYSKPKSDYQPKGLRKRSASLKTNCPCKVVLRRLSYNMNVLTTIFVCDHHNHELSKEAFLKLQHGRRLPPMIKEEIMDLLYLDVNPAILMHYVQAKTGLALRRSYFFNVIRTMKKNNVERRFTADQLTMLYEKIDELKNKYSKQKIKEQGVNRRRSKKVNDCSIDESADDALDSTSPGRLKRAVSDDENRDSPNKKSRLETCLQKLSYDEKTLESVKQLQNSVQSETQSNSWVNEEIITAARGSTNEQPSQIEANDQYVVIDTTNVPEDVTIEYTEVENMGESNIDQSYIVESCPVETYSVTEHTECEGIYDSNYVSHEQETNQEKHSNENITHATAESNNTKSADDRSDIHDTDDRNGEEPEFDYIHRFNIDQYMIQPWFVSYIDKAAKDTNTNIIDMLNYIYSGKAMFKMIVTKKSDTKTIRISYVLENVPKFEMIDNSHQEHKIEATKYCKKLMVLKKKLAESSTTIRRLSATAEILRKENHELKSRSQLAEKTRDLEQHIQQLEQTKDSLLSDIAEASNKKMYLEEIKNNLKTDIYNFVTKTVLLKQVSGSNVQSLNEIKNILGSAIKKSRKALLTSNLDGESSNDVSYVNNKKESK